MSRRVVVIVYDGFFLLDAAGPVGALESAGHFVQDGYSVELTSLHGGMIRSSSGIRVETLPFAAGAPVDLMIVPGGPGARTAAATRDMVCLIRTISAVARRAASVCSGAFLLAAAGLLEGKRATTHWGEAGQLRRDHPAVLVDADCIFIQEGNVWTSAGITAGIDLAVALVEADHGFAVAQQVAHSLVMYHRRLGGQLQFSALLELQGPDGRFGPLLEWARERLHERLDVDRLADQSSLSPRQFSRAFTRATGLPPARAIEKMRVDRARAEIVAGQESLERVARRHGFGTAARMRRAFLRVFGRSPQSFRSA